MEIRIWQVDSTQSSDVNNLPQKLRTMNIDLSQMFVTTKDTILDSIACIDRTIAEIALVVDQDEKLIDTITDSRHVVTFPVREYWLDIGRIEDYQKALQDIKNSEQ